MHVINPTSPQLWHRIRVKVGDTSRTEKFPRKPTYEYQLEAFARRGSAPSSWPAGLDLEHAQVGLGLLAAMGRCCGRHVTPGRPDPAALGVVVVGTGFGCITHVRGLHAAGFAVFALVGRDPDRTAERAPKAGVPITLTSFDEALAVEGVDAVTIATPPHSHAELALSGSPPVIT